MSSFKNKNDNAKQQWETFLMDRKSKSFSKKLLDRCFCKFCGKDMINNMACDAQQLKEKIKVMAELVWKPYVIANEIQNLRKRLIQAKVGEGLIILKAMRILLDQMEKYTRGYCSISCERLENKDYE